MNVIQNDNASRWQLPERINRSINIALLGVSLAVALAACGGGGVLSGATLSGKLMDGYITGGVVCLDVNNDGVCNPGEPVATTAASGVYNITLPYYTTTTGKHLLAVIASGVAYDSDTPGSAVTKTYTLRAPAETPAVVSPLTTLVSLNMLANPASSISEAQTKVITDLGVTASEITTDYIAANNTATHNTAKFLAALLTSAESVTVPTSQSILSAVNSVATPANVAAAASVVDSTSLTTFINNATAVPNAPIIGTATGGNAQATVNFTAPSVLTGSPITGYTVTSIPAGGFDVDAGTTKLTHNIINLANGTPYTFTVHAINVLGNGVESSASNSVTPSGTSTLTLSSGFGTALATVEKGSYGGYSGSNLDNYNCTGGPNWCGSGSTIVSGSVTAAQSSAYYYYQTPSPATGEYVGMYVMAPGVTAISKTADTAGVQITNQTNLNFTFNNNAEWLASSNKNFGVILTLGKHYMAGSPAAACNIKLLAVVTATSSSATNYTIPLNSFTVTQSCGVSSLTATAALALSPVSEVDFQGDSGASALTANGLTTSANTSVAKAGVYPTALALTGGITFSLPPAPNPALTLSSGFATTLATVEGGSYGGYSGSNLETPPSQGDNYCTVQPSWCGSGATIVSGSVTAAQSSAYYYYQTPSPATEEYVGMYVMAPGVKAISTTADTAGVQITNQTNLKFTFNDNAEWFASSNKNFAVILTLGKLYMAGFPAAACNIKLLAVVTPTSSSATNYSIPLSSFTVTQSCGFNTLTATVALGLSPVSEVDFQGISGVSALTSNLLTTGTNTSNALGGVYPTTLALTGGITFQ